MAVEAPRKGFIIGPVGRADSTTIRPRTWSRTSAKALTGSPYALQHHPDQLVRARDLNHPPLDL
jgi:hypothetical protein